MREVNEKVDNYFVKEKNYSKLLIQKKYNIDNLLPDNGHEVVRLP